MDESPNLVPVKVQPKDLPSPPMVLARIIRMANDPSVPLEQLATVVASDAAFAAEIIRTANSAFYGAQTEVKSTGRAIMMLGGRTLRCLAICFAARDITGSVGMEPEDLTDFWEDSLRRAVAARRIARLTRAADPEEAFTVGLLLEFGMIALLRANPGRVNDWRSLRKEMPEQRRSREGEIFGVTHDRVARDLASEWGLPAGLTLAIAHHHHPKSPNLPPAYLGLATIAGLADTIAAVYTANDGRVALAEARSGLQSELRLLPSQVDDLLKSVAGDVTEAAHALGVRVRRQPTHDEILMDANRALAALNLSYEEMTVRLERALREKEVLALELQKVNQRLQELVYFDPLTGLANRRRYEESFLKELTRMRTEGGTMCVLLFDLDHFKNINDQHGHVFGDTVLQAVSQVLQRATRASDVKARIGGEEMALLLPGTSEAEARALAERLRANIEAIDLRTAKAARVRVTASIGGITVGASPGMADGPERMRAIQEEADRALYAAKRAGRNRVCWSGESGPVHVETF
jgi:diguanylate cyclase (GGDEF)-like protein